MEQQSFFTWAKHNGREQKYAVLVDDEGVSIAPMDEHYESITWPELWELLKQRKHGA